MQYLLKAIIPTGDGFVFEFDALAWTALAFLIAYAVMFMVLFFRILKGLKLGNMIFFSILPLSLAYGGLLVYLTAVKSMEGATAESVRAMMNIPSTADGYNDYLWAILVTIVYLVLVFAIVVFACRPLSKVEKITGKLGDGRMKTDDFKVGGGKQFREIENSLNKINFNYKQKDNRIKQTNLQNPRSQSRQFYKFFGKNSIEELELGNQVKKTATVLLCDLKSKNDTKSLSLEENFNYINSYLKVVCPLIKRFDGFVDKYFGDGIVSVFASSRDAIECSHAILRAIEVKNKSQKEKPAIDAKLCVNTDDVVFAIVGDDEQKLPTIVSNAVEIAQKINEINVYIGAKLLISKSSLNNLPHNYEFEYRYTGDLSLENGGQMALYESLCYYPKSKREKLKKLKNKFEEGVRAYNQKEYARAKEVFEFVLHYVSDDLPAYLYFNKASEKLAEAA